MIKQHTKAQEQSILSPVIVSAENDHHSSSRESFCHQIDSWCILKASYKAHLVILEPGQALGGQHEPVLLRSSLHDADVIDGQPALTDHLMIKPDASHHKHTLTSETQQETRTNVDE